MPAVADSSEERSERGVRLPVTPGNRDNQDAMSPDRIARIRERAGWTLQEMGDTLGVSRVTVHRWETAKRRPNQYHQEVLLNIERQLDEMEKERQRKQFVQAITGLAAGAGVGALLSYLFDPNSGNSGDSESTDQSQ